LRKTDWEYTDVLWGSKAEYFAFESWLPTPLNAFGLMKFIDPYHWERKHYYDRPFPVSGSGPLSQIPMLGQVLGPIDMLIKPRIEMHTEDTKRMIMTFEANRAKAVATLTRTSESLNNLIVQMRAYGMEADRKIANKYAEIYKDLYEAYMSEEMKPVYEQSLGNKISEFGNWMQDYLGLIGFMAGSYTTAGFGNKDKIQPMIASSGIAFGQERLYYQKSLGGMFGLTEFYRRINTRDYSTWGNQYINEIPNEYMQRNYPWLPGEDYFINFKKGDVYSKIPYGEIRLPGAGYEATHKLYDDYGLIDKYLILANVAPYSKEFRQISSVVEKIKHKLPEEIRYKIQSTNEQIEAQKKRYEFNRYPYSTPMKKVKVKLGKYIGEGKFATTEPYAVQIHGFETDIDAIAKRIYESQNVTIEQAYKLAERKATETQKVLETLAGNEVTLLVPADKGLRYTFESTKEIYLNAILPNQRKIMEEKELIPDTSTDLGKRAYYGTNVFRMLWERISHTHLYLFEKFAGQYSPEEYYERYVTYGKERALWQKPIEDYIKPIFFNIAASNPISATLHGALLGAMAGGSFGASLLSSTFFGAVSLLSSTTEKIARIGGGTILPEETKERWELETKYDYLRGIRGDTRHSIYATGTASTVRSVAMKMPRIDREFFEEFVNAPVSERSRIMRIAPPYMQSMLEHFWTMKDELVSKGYAADINIHVEQTNRYLSEIEKVKEEVEPFMLQPYINIDALRTMEIAQKFDDLMKFDIYYDDIRNAQTLLMDFSAIPNPESTAMLQSMHTSMLHTVASSLGGYAYPSLAPRGAQIINAGGIR